MLTVSKHFAAESTVPVLDNATAAIWPTLSPGILPNVTHVLVFIYDNKASNDAYIE